MNTSCEPQATCPLVMFCKREGCKDNGGKELAAAFANEMNIGVDLMKDKSTGQLTIPEEGIVSIQTRAVFCFANCGFGPVVRVQENSSAPDARWVTCSHATIDSVKEAIGLILKGGGQVWKVPDDL